MSGHSRHDNCAESTACYEAGYGAGWRAALDAYMTLRCWCGGDVGPRTPGDPAGVGCLEHLNHNWRAWLDGQPIVEAAQ